MKIPKIKSRHLLSVSDLSCPEIIDLFHFTLKLKSDLKKGRYKNYLKNKSLAMIFEKSSTRTRVSFETGITQLGGHALFLSPDDIQLGRGETIEDTARVLSRYVDCIMIRTFSHDNVITLAEFSDIPVINGLTDTFHPCQALADYFTIYEHDKDLTKVKVAYIGDGNNMANSLILTAAIMGSHISVASPEKYSPDKDILDAAYSLARESGGSIEITSDIYKAAKGAHYLYTDVWTSMGQEKETAKRKKAFARYKISSELIKYCGEDCRVMHCLPAHRGEEIDADVLNSNQSIIFDQAENRMHVQKAIMCALINRGK